MIKTKPTFHKKLPKGAVLVDSNDKVINNPKGKDPFAKLEKGKSPAKKPVVKK